MIRGAALLLPLSVMACAPGAGGDRWAPFDVSPNTPVLALPPQVGRVIGFSEERSTNKIVQTTVFAADPGTPGQNEMVVTVYRKGLAPRFSQPGIVSEMAERVPGVPMTISNTLVKNGLGPFGYAVGRQGRLTCIFAWQAIDNADEVMTGVTPGPLARNHALSIRLRLCRDNASPVTLLAAAQGLSPSGGAIAGQPLVVGGYDALTAATGVGGGWRGSLVDPVLADIPESDAPPPVRRAPRAATVDAPPAPQPMPGIVAAPYPAPAAPMPAVPLPNGVQPAMQPLPAQPAPQPPVVYTAPAQRQVPVAVPQPQPQAPVYMPQVQQQAPVYYPPVQQQVPAVAQPMAPVPTPAATQPAYGMPIVPLPPP